MIFYYILALLLGLIVGSFLNVAILRYNTGKSLKGRSLCLSCAKQLTWLELIPVFSFLRQKGRCRGCNSKISWQYIAVEILTAVIFVFIANVAINIFGGDYPFASARFFIWNSAIASLLLVIAVYDLRHKIIPDELVYGFMIMAGLTGFIVHAEIGLTQIIWLVHGLFSGAIVFALFWALWHFSHGRLMGFGDAKLVFGIGLWMGWKPALVALLIAFVVGAIIGVSLILLSKWKNAPRFLRAYSLKSEIPFAPFLVFGAIISFILTIHATPLVS
ncbi:MAG: prepilin peptidase [Patescibacteria group bacterium]|mgnify:CR=1 FL=1